MMKATYLALCLAFVPGLAGAADFSDPDWPCIQRKAVDLSPGLMWPGEVKKEALSEPAKQLVEVLSLRRVDLPEAEDQVRTFVENTKDADETLLGNIFYGVFDKIALDRRRLINGIARYSQSQIALTEKVEEARTEMAKLMAAPEPDYDRVDALEEEIDWRERVFLDRQKSLTYVCETPVILEKRAYAIAQTLLKYAPKP